MAGRHGGLNPAARPRPGRPEYLDTCAVQSATDVLGKGRQTLIDVPKNRQEDVARQALDGVAEGLLEVLADDTSRSLKESLS